MKSNFSTEDFEQQESLMYRPGQRVELVTNPGVVDVISEYDPMMVPPIWLKNDPKPRYPHELNLLPMPVLGSSWLNVSRRRLARHPMSKSSGVLTTQYK
jgi:hypothetical protein